MLIPIRSDATAWYRAWATFAIIAANLLLYFFVNPVNHIELLVLEFGTLKPWQWITCAFTHAGFFHVAVNMLFLFWFGQIVEGHLGTLRFLAIYFGIAAASGLVTQVAMLSADGGGAVGASGVIFGLMVVALACTPKTSITCLLWFYPIVRVFELSVVGFAGIYLAWNILWAVFSGFGMSSMVLHLIGAMAGLAAMLVIKYAGWWYEPPEDEVGGDLREKPVVPASVPKPPPAVDPPAHEDLPPLELD